MTPAEGGTADLADSMAAPPQADKIEAKIRAAFGPWQGKAMRSAVPAVSPRQTSAAIGLVEGRRATVKVSIGYLGGIG